jgi:hypothetical protein
LSNITSKISEQNKFFAKKVTSGLGNMIGKFTDSKIVKALKEIEKYLGKNPKLITNQSGDIVMMSANGKRKVRFDINKPHGYEPHAHVQKFVKGKWVDAVPQHHLYFKK